MSATGSRRCGRIYDDEVDRLLMCSQLFVEAMRDRLIDALDRGRSGWDASENMEALRDAMANRVAHHLAEGGQEVDIANYMMFLWALRNSAKRADDAQDIEALRRGRQEVNTPKILTQQVN